jgi:hypothetical protein
MCGRYRTNNGTERENAMKNKLEQAAATLSHSALVDAAKEAHALNEPIEIRTVFEGLLGRKLGPIVASGSSDDEETTVKHYVCSEPLENAFAKFIEELANIYSTTPEAVLEDMIRAGLDSFKEELENLGY